MMRTFQKVGLKGSGPPDQVFLGGLSNVPGEQHAELPVFQTQNQGQLVVHLVFSMGDGLQDEFRAGVEGGQTDLADIQRNAGCQWHQCRFLRQSFLF